MSSQLVKSFKEFALQFGLFLPSVRLGVALVISEVLAQIQIRLYRPAPPVFPSKGIPSPVTRCNSHPGMQTKTDADVSYFVT